MFTCEENMLNWEMTCCFTRLTCSFWFSTCWDFKATCYLSVNMLKTRFRLVETIHVEKSDLAGMAGHLATRRICRWNNTILRNVDNLSFRMLGKEGDNSTRPRPEMTSTEVCKPFILLLSRGGQTFILMKETCLSGSGGIVLDSSPGRRCCHDH